MCESSWKVKRYLLESLDVEAVGPSGLAARFTTADLRAFLRERGLPGAGRKTDLALRLSRALKSHPGYDPVGGSR